MEAIRLIRHCAKYVSERPQVSMRLYFVNFNSQFLSVKVPKLCRSSDRRMIVLRQKKLESRCNGIKNNGDIIAFIKCQRKTGRMKAVLRLTAERFRSELMCKHEVMHLPHIYSHHPLAQLWHTTVIIFSLNN